jgi:paraquat-inducible protein B
MEDNSARPERSRITKTRYLSFAFITPLVAVLIAFWLVIRAIPEKGPDIDLIVSTADGISPKSTKVRYRGIDVGEVVDVHLDEDYENAVIAVQLFDKQDRFARSGAEFWIIKPELSLGKVSGLTTIITGRYIEAKPGNGPPKKSFRVMDESPVSEINNNDLKIQLFSAEADAIQKGTNILYRDIKIGHIQEVYLSDDSSRVMMDAVINRKYAKLVRKNSVFWKEKGLSVDFSLLKGFDFNVENFQSILGKQIKMATPVNFNERAADGYIFRLDIEGTDEWILWNPKIPLDTDNDEIMQQYTQAAKAPQDK